jgi:hypothetical protein
MGTFFDILTIISVLAFVLSMAARGQIGPEMAAVALVVLVVLIAMARAGGMSLTRLIFRIALPLLSIWGLIVQYGGSDPRATAALVGQLLTLVIMLFGLYIMFSFPFRKRR